MKGFEVGSCIVAARGFACYYRLIESLDDMSGIAPNSNSFDRIPISRFGRVRYTD